MNIQKIWKAHDNCYFIKINDKIITIFPLSRTHDLNDHRWDDDSMRLWPELDLEKGLKEIYESYNEDFPDFEF